MDNFLTVSLQKDLRSEKSFKQRCLCPPPVRKFSRLCYGVILLSGSWLSVCLCQALDCKDMYPGCCTLRIDYSRMATLNVKYNNDKSRDFTNPNLPRGDEMAIPGHPVNGSPPTHSVSAPANPLGQMSKYFC